MSSWCPPCSLSLEWGSLGELRVLNPAPAGKLHTAACLHRGTSVFSPVTDKCFVKWMVVLRRLHIIKHKWRDEWSVNGVILWSHMKESFEAVLVLCCERAPGDCTRVILLLLLLRPDSEVCFVRNTNHLLLGLVYYWSCLGQLDLAIF